MALDRALGDQRARLRGQFDPELDLHGVGLQRAVPEDAERRLGGRPHPFEGALERTGRLDRAVRARDQPGAGLVLDAFDDDHGTVVGLELH
jgi:hypothetical protein